VSFKPKDGFRGDFIGAFDGEYVISLTVGNTETPAISVSVKLSADHETAKVTLSADR
jgi:hypothetical protein